MFRKQDELNQLVQKGIVCGLFETGYIILVASFFIIAGLALKPMASGMILGVMMVLILVVLSVAVSGALIFGYPAQYFLQKKYREGLVILGSTLATLFVTFLVLIVIVSAIY